MTAALRIGTRGSRLARAQATEVADRLAAELDRETTLVPVRTEGDVSDRPLTEFAGQGVFVSALRQALVRGDVDVAVHSLKDLPTADAPGVAVGAVTAREDVRDCLLARDGLLLQELAPGAVVGTSSLRRAAQVRGMRHDVEVRSIRGNVDTRIRKVREGEFDAVVLAAAGVRRLGLDDEVSEWFEPETMVPAPGQGALAVTARADDADARAAAPAPPRGPLRTLPAHACAAPATDRPGPASGRRHSGPPTCSPSCD
jgi:hydroxymethylbilane synthase